MTISSGDNLSSQGGIASKPARLIRSPLLPVAAAMIVGIILGRYVRLPVGAWGILAVAAIAAALATIRREHLRTVTSWSIALAVFSLSALYTHVTYYSTAADDIVTYTDYASILATVRGRIVSSPTLVEDEQSTSRRDRQARMLFVLDAGQIRTSAGWKPANGLVRVTVHEECPKLAAGQDVEVVGTMGRIRPPDNPGQTDWSAYGRENHLMVWVSVPARDGVAVTGGENPTWVERSFWHIRSAARQHLLSCGDRDDARLVDALLIGERHPALQKLNLQMVRAGIAHMLSISGQHLAVFLSFMYLICRLTNLSPPRSAAIVLVILLAYMLLAEPNAPLWRSAIMAGTMCLATIFSRQYGALNAISAAAVILLGLDPMQLFNAGFQLSFVIVAGMIVLHRPMREFLFGRWLAHRGLIVFRKEHRLRRWLYFGLAEGIITTLTASISAYVVSAPLVAYHFGLFSPYAGVLSILLSPLMALVLVPGYISMALAWPMPNLSAAMGDLSAWGAWVLAGAVDLSSHLPMLAMELRPVGVAWTIACYAVIILFLLRGRGPWGKVVLAISLLVLAGFTVWTQRTAPPPPSAQLNVLAVGDGQCIILRTPAGGTYLLDAGSRSLTNIFQQDIAPFLRDQRLPAPTAVFVSHAHSDHFDALPDVAGACKFSRAYLNDYFVAPLTSQPARPTFSPDPDAMELLKTFEQNHIEIKHLRAGDKIDLDGRTKVEVLWPPAQKRSDLPINDTSLALRITCDDKSVLIPGDAEAITQAQLSANPPAVRADVLVLPHHGSWRKTLPAFVDAVGPAFVIVSNSFDPRPPAKDQEAAKFYEHLKSDCRYLLTSRNGWVRVNFGGGKIEIKTMR